jgi:hypothetical protein
LAEEILAFGAGAILGHLLIGGKKIPVIVPKTMAQVSGQASEALAEIEVDPKLYSQSGRVIPVSNLNAAQIVPPNPKVKSITVANLDANNILHLRLGNTLRVNEGIPLPPQCYAFYSTLFGDTPNVGLWAIAENAVINAEVDY